VTGGDRLFGGAVLGDVRHDPLPLLQVALLADEEAHPLRDQAHAVAQIEPELVDLIDVALERRQAGQVGHGGLILAVVRAYTGLVEQLYAPWRRAFIESAGAATEPAPCFICAAVQADPSHDREHLLLYRGTRALVIMNRFPYNSAHLLVAPTEHTGDFAHLEAATRDELGQVAQRCVGVLQAVYRPDAFNLGMNLGRAAGAGLPDHLHTHVVPRWIGDTNFMPIAADTKVMPETLDQTYDRLRPPLHDQA
jgi:ATP adenylyltransferase